MTSPSTRTAEPKLVLSIVAAIVNVVVVLNVGLTSDQAGLLVAAISAVAALFAALRVRPIAPGVFTAAFTALAAVASSFGLHLPPAMVGAVTSLVLVALSAIFRQQVTARRGSLI
jgi:hypothetical protein